MTGHIPLCWLRGWSSPSAFSVIPSFDDQVAYLGLPSEFSVTISLPVRVRVGARMEQTCS
jgi:hypothetical protein